MANKSNVKVKFHFPVPLFKFIDHTGAAAKHWISEGDLLMELNIARTYGIRAVWVIPHHVEIAARVLQGTGIKICVMIGRPYIRSDFLPRRLCDIRMALRDGAHEVNWIPVEEDIQSNNWPKISEEIEKAQAIMQPKKALLNVVLFRDLAKGKERRLGELCRENHVSCFGIWDIYWTDTDKSRKLLIEHLHETMAYAGERTTAMAVIPVDDLAQDMVYYLRKGINTLGMCCCPQALETLVEANSWTVALNPTGVDSRGTLWINPERVSDEELEAFIDKLGMKQGE
ncbi:hypothetical protein BJ166DRAFT_601521 [Pestalotiopsis sp. NC0098]|nr:hypothetical protein BJ166DRAFT_601521 [Pestalotiopsis sp. NC0098]